MPIDDTLLQTKIIDLQVRSRELRSKHKAVQEAITQLQIIIQKEEEQVDPTDSTKTIKVPVDIVDEGTSKKMAVIRRQEIYDIWMPKADIILT